MFCQKCGAEDAAPASKYHGKCGGTWGAKPPATAPAQLKPAIRKTPAPDGGGADGVIAGTSARPEDVYRHAIGSPRSGASGGNATQPASDGRGDASAEARQIAAQEQARRERSEEEARQRAVQEENRRKEEAANQEMVEIAALGRALSEKNGLHAGDTDPVRRAALTLLVEAMQQAREGRFGPARQKLAEVEKSLKDEEDRKAAEAERERVRLASESEAAQKREFTELAKGYKDKYGLGAKESAPERVKAAETLMAALRLAQDRHYPEAAQKLGEIDLLLKPRAEARPPTQPEESAVIHAAVQEPPPTQTTPSGATEVGSASTPVEGAQVADPHDLGTKVRKLGLPKAHGDALASLAARQPEVAGKVADVLGTLSKAVASRKDALAAVELAARNVETARKEREAALDLNNTTVAEVKKIRERKGDETKAWADYQSAKAALENADKKKSEAEEAERRAKEVEKETNARELLLDAVSFGPLSKPLAGKVKAEDLQTVIDTYKDHPELADDALQTMSSAEHPATVVKGLRVLGPLGAGGFKYKNPKDGTIYERMPDTARSMARTALQMGGLLGGDYFERMAAYYKNLDGPHSKADPTSPPAGGDDYYGAKTVNVTRAMATAAIGPDGKPNFAAAGMKSARDNLHFHPDSLLNPLPALAAHVEGVVADFTGPRKADMEKVLTDMKAPATGGVSVIRKTLGLQASARPQLNDARAAVISAMMTPFAQGQVGSCFATAPCRKARIGEPAMVMQDFAQIAQTGTLTKGGQDPVPVVSNIAKNENPLLRGWEYTVATLGARDENSAQKQTLGSSLFGEYGGQDRAHSLEALASEFPADWAAKKSGIQAELARGFSFTYDPSVERPDAADGSSTRGAFVMKDRTQPPGERAITQEAEFMAAVKRSLTKALNADGKNRTIGPKIDALLGSDAFKQSLLVAYERSGKQGSPWELPGGGQSEGASELLFGSPPTEATIEMGTTPGMPSKAAALLKGLLDPAKLPADDFATASVDGIHSMNILPNHPSLDALKGPDREAKINQALVRKGKDIADADLGKERTAYVHRKAVGTIARQFELAADEQALLENAAPGAGQKPGALKQTIMNSGVDVIVQRRLAAAEKTILQEIERRVAEANAEAERDASERANKDANDQAREAAAKALAQRLKDGPLDPGAQRSFSQVEFDKAFQRIGGPLLEQYTREALAGVDAGAIATAVRKEKKDDIKADVTTKLGDAVDSLLLQELDFPAFVIADTNWGGPVQHVHMVVAPDPSTGEPTLWKKGDPGGKFSRETPDWLEAGWKYTN